MYTRNLSGENFVPNARRLAKLEPNEFFNDFAISRQPIDEIDSNFFYFKGMDSKIIPNSIGGLTFSLEAVVGSRNQLQHKRYNQTKQTKTRSHED